MSLFLAPIHYTMYEKIKNQDKINQLLLDKFEKYGIEENLKKEFGSLPEGDLKDIIDQSNIHGWLQSKIDIVEESFSYITEKLLEEGIKKSEILEFFKCLGSETKNLKTAEEIYQKFTGMFLDGMPCDRAIEPVEVSENIAKWNQNIDVHGKYWTDNGLMYKEIRKAWLDDLSEENGFSFEESDDRYEVRK